MTDRVRYTLLTSGLVLFGCGDTSKTQGGGDATRSAGGSNTSSAGSVGGAGRDGATEDGTTTTGTGGSGGPSTASGTGGSSGGGSGGSSGGGSGGESSSSGGGVTGSGGAGGSSAGVGGSGGAIVGEAVELDELVGELDGRLTQFPCVKNQISGDSCDSGAFVGPVYHECVDSVLELEVDHPIGGTPGAIYDLTLHFYGIAELKNYGPEAVREASERPENLNSGADPPPWAVGEPGMTIPESEFGTYEIHVLDETLQEVGLYFVNADSEEDRYTFVIDYERTIPIVGGGVVRLRRVDGDCRVLLNCGAADVARDNLCSSGARFVNITEADPPPPDGGPFEGGLTQPAMNAHPNAAGQWWLIDAVAAVPR